MTTADAEPLERTQKVSALRIAMVAPPWIPVPPRGYGGIEAVVAALVRGLGEAGHEVVLYAAPGSHSEHARVVPVLDGQRTERIGRARDEADHIATVFRMLERERFDVLHDHGDGTLVAFADRLRLPVVHTLHGPFDDASSEFYRRHGECVSLVALSHAQARMAPPGVHVDDVIANPLDLDDWPLRCEKDGPLLWIGRFAPEKGAHDALIAAREARVPLTLAGVVQPGQERYFARSVEPYLGEGIAEFVGEVTGRRRCELYAKARALLMPITWPEPFGMVMVEAMACGTPVIAYPAGSAPELIDDGVTGFLVDAPEAMAKAIRRVGDLDPAEIRASAVRRFGLATVAAGYERAYRRAIASPRSLSVWPVASAS
jgi:glycosyltransferase involved in cell wall biosynthesis